MPRVCKACIHPERRRLEAQAIEGLPAAHLSRTFGIPAPGIIKHMRRHAKRALETAAESRNGKAGNALLDAIDEAGKELITLARGASSADEITAAVNAWQGRLRSLELRGKVTGEIAASGNLTIIAQLGGARVDQARQAVEVVRDAQSVPPRAVAERAAAVLKLWNAEQTDRADCIEVFAPRIASEPGTT